MICGLGFEATRMFQILLLATYSAYPTLCIKNSRSQNSINPRNLSAIDTSEACIDVETRKRYIIGETYIKEDKCCTCRLGGTDCKRVKFCRLGCKKNSRYYRDGEFIPSRSCYNCSCHNGTVACFFDVSCLQGKCSYWGRIYDEGDVLHLKKSCKDCVCTSGRWNCMMLICSVVKSEANLSDLHQDRRSYLTRVAVLTVLLLTQWLSLVCSFG